MLQIKNYGRESGILHRIDRGTLKCTLEEMEQRVKNAFYATSRERESKQADSQRKKTHRIAREVFDPGHRRPVGKKVTIRVGSKMRTVGGVTMKRKGGTGGTLSPVFSWPI